MPVLQIIIASTRPGRLGLPVAEWFAERELGRIAPVLGALRTEQSGKNA
jgi:hypothetical protein